MSTTTIRGALQIRNGSITKDKLVSDFLQGSNLSLTGGSRNATLDDLAPATSDYQPVIKQQLDALAASVSGALSLQDEIDCSVLGAQLDDCSRGYYYVVTVAGTLFAGNNPIVCNVGDHLICKTDVVGTPTDGAAFFLQDNSEASDLLRDSDIVAALNSTDDTAVLAASQGKILQDAIDSIIGQLFIAVSGEERAVTNGSAVIPALLNAHIAGSDHVYLNGMRMKKGAGSDYTINDSTGVITFEYNLTSQDVVLVDYLR